MPSKEEVQDFLTTQFPQSRDIVEAVGDRSATIRHRVGFADLRPGNTVAGPVLMGAADLALYVAILGEIGIVALAVTTNLSINFLRKPAADKDIIAECRLIKVGKVLIVGEVALYSEGEKEPVAHVTGTYSVPPQR
ncbi:MAG: hypothetical protein DHS20C12_15980 [Pseudohongiella sp.]|nr:MAG: hypothetical protein DHS20C12_15980 [Pseudohongiella sp.]